MNFNIKTIEHKIDLDKVNSIIDKLFEKNKEYSEIIKNKIVDKSFKTNEIIIEINLIDEEIFNIIVQQLRNILDLLPVKLLKKNKDDTVYSQSSRKYGIDGKSLAVLSEVGYMDSLETILINPECEATEVSITLENKDGSEKIVAIPAVTDLIVDMNGKPLGDKNIFQKSFITYILPNETLYENYELKYEYHKGMKRYLALSRSIDKENNKMYIKFRTYYNDTHEKIWPLVKEYYKKINEDKDLEQYKVSLSENYDNDLYKIEKNNLDLFFDLH